MILLHERATKPVRTTAIVILSLVQRKSALGMNQECMVGASVNRNAGDNRNGRHGCTHKTRNQSPTTPTDE
jgi:hypothetical protein